MEACIHPAASIVGSRTPYLSHLTPCLRMDVGLSRRDAVLAAAMFALESFGLARCCLSMSLAAAEECDVLLSIGTSGIVYPAAELPLRALGHGAAVVHINPMRFDVSSQEHFLQGPASVMMQSLIREAFSAFPAS